MAVLLVVFGASVNQPLTDDPDTLLISALESPTNFDPFPVYFEKKSQASDSALPTETIVTSETLQSRFSQNSRPNPKPFNLVLDNNSTSHLQLEDFFGTPQPPTPTIANALQASQLDQLSNIKIKHRSDTSPSAYKTLNKKKITKKHLIAKHKYKKKGHRGTQQLKYPKQVKKPIKIRIFSQNVEDSAKLDRKIHNNKRKDWRRITSDDEEKKEEEKPSSLTLTVPLKTIDKGVYKDSSDLEPVLGPDTITTDFLGKLREMTGGEMVAVTRDVKKYSKSEKESKGKLRKEIENSLVEKNKLAGPKKEVKKNISHFEDFPIVDQKAPTPGPRRQERQLKQFTIPEKKQSVVTKRQHKRLVGSVKPRTKSNKKFRKGRLGSVGTVERFRYENADGSITWGYTNEDGSFKEETIGVDCVTHGRYGYVDPTGEAREYSYTSGIRCDPDTRQIEKTADTLSERARGHFDYPSRKFVMPDGRRVTVRVNQNKRARGKRA